MSDDLQRRSTAWTWTARSVAAVAAVVAVAVVGWRIREAQAPPSSVRPIVWDRQACDHCKMAVSDPAFAAQLQTEDGRVYDFDDPGCLFQFQDAERPRVHALYFHAMRGDEWLSGDEAVFVPGVRSPMGFDLGTAQRGTPGALGREEAARRVLDDPKRREGP